MEDVEPVVVVLEPEYWVWREVEYTDENAIGLPPELRNDGAVI